MSIPIMALPTPAEFARLGRVERLHVLRAAQDLWGLDDSRYHRLAHMHAHMIRNGMVVEDDR